MLIKILCFKLTHICTDTLYTHNHKHKNISCVLIIFQHLLKHQKPEISFVSFLHFQIAVLPLNLTLKAVKVQLLFEAITFSLNFLRRSLYRQCLTDKNSYQIKGMYYSMRFFFEISVNYRKGNNIFIILISLHFLHLFIL